MPPKKPSQYNDEQKNVDKEVVLVKKKLPGGLILPKSKPLVVKKDKSIVQRKSKYFSEKDFKIANQAIKLMEKRNWFEAENIKKKKKINQFMILFNGTI